MTAKKTDSSNNPEEASNNPSQEEKNNTTEKEDTPEPESKASEIKPVEDTEEKKKTEVDEPTLEEMSIQHKIENLPGILLDEDEAEKAKEEIAKESKEKDAEKGKNKKTATAHSTPQETTGATVKESSSEDEGKSSSRELIVTSEADSPSAGQFVKTVILVAILVIAGLYVWGRQIVLQEQAAQLSNPAETIVSE